jgi:Flp pilus assembly pilin Flp
MSLCLLWFAHQCRQLADRRREESGQATVEYALVVLAAATIALLVLAWASRTGKVGQLLDAVFDQVSGRLG